MSKTTPDRRQFDAELQAFRARATAPAGAAAFPSAPSLLSALLELLQDGGAVEQLYTIWQRLRGGEAQSAPPEPSS